MSSKSIVMLFMTVGSIAGAYISVLFGVKAFSFTSVILSAVGGILGIYIGYKISG